MASSYGAESESEPKTSSDKGLGIVIRIDRVSWQPIVFGLLFLVALIMRLWDLDGRAYHYDETIHAFDSWQLFKGNGYIHSPWAHGPFLYHVSAVSIFLFGDNLASPRLVPALFGALLVITPWFLRNRLGVWGAIAVAALLAFSPSIFYFSRFLRNDIFTLVFDVALIITMWRFFETRQARWLVLGAVALALAFSSKETAFISMGIVVLFLAAWWLSDGAPSMWRGLIRRLRPVARQPVGNGESEDVGYALPANDERTPGQRQITPVVGFLILLIALTLPLFAAVPGLVIDKFGFGFHTVVMDVAMPATQVGAPDGSTAGYVVASVIAGILFLLGAVAGYLWHGRVFLLAWGVFYAIFLVLHTTFFTNMVGFGTGVWQSLGYWIAQQEVERGSQPWYYYFVQLPVYEFLPFFFGIAAAWVFMVRRRLGFLVQTLLIMTVAGLVAWGLYPLVNDSETFGKAFLLPIAVGGFFVTALALRSGDRFEWFLVHWSGFALLAYIAAGEKMPWLLTHLTLPFVFLAGKFIGELITSIEWRSALRSGSFGLLFLAPILLVVIYALATNVPWDNNDLGIWSFIGPLIASAVVIVGTTYVIANLGLRRTLPILGLSLVGLMAVFTIRTAFETTYANGDNADELIVYSQLAPAVHQAALDIGEAARRSGRGQELRILADSSDAAVAPWRWYLREFPHVYHVDLSDYEGEFDHDVILVNPRHDRKLEAVREEYEDARRITFLTWFNPFEVYSGYDAGQFWDDLGSARAWNQGLRYFTYREIATDPASQDALIYFSKDLF